MCDLLLISTDSLKFLFFIFIIRLYDHAQKQKRAKQEYKNTLFCSLNDDTVASGMDVGFCNETLTGCRSCR